MTIASVTDRLYEPSTLLETHALRKSALQLVQENRAVGVDEATYIVFAVLMEEVTLYQWILLIFEKEI